MERYEVVVLDLDNTVAKLDVDWDAVSHQLTEVARGGGIELSETGIHAVMEAARRPGMEAVHSRLEWLLTAAEVAGAAGCPRNEAMVRWVEALDPATPVSVLSLNSRKAVLEALRIARLDGRVSHVVGREDVEHGKPDPDGMLELADRHGVEPGQMLLVGDKDGDRECAERAGAAFLHVDEVGVEWRRVG